MQQPNSAPNSPQDPKNGCKTVCVSVLAIALIAIAAGVISHPVLSACAQGTVGMTVNVNTVNKLEKSVKETIKKFVKRSDSDRDE